MNTPKFQMRKMQREMVKERDYRDSLERELACKVALIAQKGGRRPQPTAHTHTHQVAVVLTTLCSCGGGGAETHINQLQYRLEKLQEEQTAGEQLIREEISGLETRNKT